MATSNVKMNHYISKRKHNNRQKLISRRVKYSRKLFGKKNVTESQEEVTESQEEVTESQDVVTESQEEVTESQEV